MNNDDDNIKKSKEREGGERKRVALNLACCMHEWPLPPSITEMPYTFLRSNFERGRGKKGVGGYKSSIRIDAFEIIDMDNMQKDNIAMMM